MSIAKEVNASAEGRALQISGYVEVIAHADEYILFNKLNGCIILFEKCRILQEADGYYLLNIDSAENRFLEENYFLINDFEVQRYIAETLSLPTEHDIANIVISVTEQCNLACKYCYQHNWDKVSALPDDKYVSLIKDYLERILPSLCERQATLCISFIGGEPLLKSELILRFVDMIQEQVRNRIPVQYYLDSNILLISQEFILHFPNLHICTTLTPAEDHNLLRFGSYERVLSKIMEVQDLLDNEKYHLLIRYNVHQDNIQGIEVILSLLKQLDFKWEFETQNITNSEASFFYNQLNDDAYQKVYLEKIVPILLSHGIVPQILPDHTLSRHCRGGRPYDRKFYSNGFVTLCDAFPKQKDQVDIPSVLPLPDMCIKCLDFPYCGGIKPCDVEPCSGKYRGKENAIERIRAYVRIQGG